MPTSNTNNIILHGTQGDHFPYNLKGRFDSVRLYDPDYALTKDPAAYEKMLRDPIIRQALQIRYRVAAGGTWSCVPARDGDERDMLAAQVMQDCLDQIAAFQNARTHLAGAIFRGTSYATLEGERGIRRFGDDKPREWWFPTSLSHIDKRMVRHLPHRDDFGYDMEIFTRSGEWVPISEHELVRVVYDNEQGRLGFGRGLAESTYFFFYGKLRTLEEGLQGLERWAQGFLLGKVNADAIGDTTQSTQNAREDMLDMLNKMRSKYGAVVDTTEDVQLVETSGSGHQIVTELLAYFDNALTRVITGSALPAGDGGKAGSYARAQTELEVSESISQVDSEVLDQAITRDVVRMCWELNLENLAEMGLQDAEMPVFKSANEQKEDPKENAEVAQIMLNSGAPIKREEYYERTGWSMPADDDDVIMPPSKPEPDTGEEGKTQNRESGVKAHALTDDVYIPSAAVFAAMFSSLGDDDGLGFGSDWFSRAMRKFRGVLRRLAKSIAASLLGDSSARPQNEVRETWVVIADSMAAADLEGRGKILDIAEDVDPTEIEDSDDVPVPDAGLPDDAPRPQPDSTPADPDAPPTTVPKIPFGEAVQDIVERYPVLAKNAEAVSKAYREGPAFALAKSVEIQTTEAVQSIVAETMGEGTDPRESIEEIAKESEDFTDSYAETVLRTNVATAHTQGQFEQAKDPEFRKMVPAFLFSATPDDAVRQGRRKDHGENHLAAHGLVAAIDDPIWKDVAPPLGYRCRCKVVGMSKYELARHKPPLIDDDGNVTPFIPEGYDKFAKHPNFKRNKMPGA